MMRPIVEMKTKAEMTYVGLRMNEKIASKMMADSMKMYVR